MNFTYTFVTKLWKYSGEGAWYFVSLPKEYSDEIQDFTHGWKNKGFGTVKVIASVGAVSWSTSVFPDKKRGTYLMPIKKEIRSKLNVEEGDEIKLSLELPGV